MRPCRRASALTLVAVAIAAFPVRAQAPVFRSATDAVRVDVLVADRRGAPVPGLASKDFVLRDNGVAQSIAVVAFEELPLHVVLVLDTSGSVEGESFERLVAAARGLLEELRPVDAASLVVFSHVLSVQPLQSGRIDDAEQSLRRLSAFGRSSVFDATWVSLLNAVRPGFRSLVVLSSDGFDNRSWLDLNDVVEFAKRVDSVVYCVRVPPKLPEVPEWMQRARRQGFKATVPAGARNLLEKIAEESGGRVLRADADTDLQPAMLRILDEFRRRYVLTYVPAGVDAGGWHAIEVTMRGKAATVTARRGYQRDWPK